MRQTKKIKILFLIDHLYGFGGSERHLFQLVTNLNKEKFECIICALMAREEIINKFIDNGINIVHIPIERSYGFKALFQSLKLRRLIKKNDIDIVQTFHFTSDTYGAIVSRLAGVSHIISSRRDMGDLKKKSQLIINRKINRLIDHFIVVSDAVGRTLILNEGIPPQKIKTIYNGVDLSSWDAMILPDGENVKAELKVDETCYIVGYVAHFRYGKGHNVFFEAMRKIKPLIKNIKALVVGGRGSGLKLMNYYKQFCDDHDLNDNVIFTGYTEEVRTLYEAMAVYCLVSDNEGCSNSILEAMASGKPVIATAVGGNPEVVIDGETGFLIPPNDPDALVQALLKLYHDPELRTIMGQNARQRIEKELSLERMIKKNEKLYIQLCENNTA